MIARRAILQCLAATLSTPVLANEDFQSMWDRRIGHDPDRILDQDEPRAGVAQSVERRIENPRVGGSTPSPGTTHSVRHARDPVCGKRGRRYFHIGHRLSWRCGRAD
jgi:hypothetical protein